MLDAGWTRGCLKLWASALEPHRPLYIRVHCCPAPSLRLVSDPCPVLGLAQSLLLQEAHPKDAPVQGVSEHLVRTPAIFRALVSVLFSVSSTRPWTPCVSELQHSARS